MRLAEANPILRNLLSDLGAQPDWRSAASIDMAWRDNHQWTKEQIDYLASLGLTSMMVNLMAPAMEAVTGYEAKHRVDWMLTGASEEHDEMAEGINHELNDEMRLAKANHACSQAYESQACVGIGWVHVRKNTDPLITATTKISEVHRNEMFWDMRARSHDLRDDCRWIARRRFFDKDEAHVFLGNPHKELIDFTFSHAQEVDIAEGGMVEDWHSDVSAYTDPIELIMENISDRQMIAIYEVYYKVFEKRDLLVAHNGFRAEFRRNNPMHLDLLVNNEAYVVPNFPLNVIKTAWFVGCHLVYDGASNEPHNNFPYVPFFGVREDGNNAPTGLLRRMISPQEQYNRAVVEIQRIMRSRRIEKDYDALHGMTDQQAIFEINRTDGVVNLKKNAKFQVIREWEKIAVLEGICKRSREEINAASGIYQTFQGQTETAQSGIAVESIAELGAQSLGKINSNYQLSRAMVGDLVFAHKVDEIGVKTRVVNIPQQIGQNKKQVTLNDGLNNRVPLLRAQVAMQDIHTSAGYKQHTHQRLTTVMKEIPEEFKGILLPFWLESSGMPKKEQAIKLINQKLGYEEDEDKRAEMEEIQAQEAEQVKQIEMRQLISKIEETEAGTKGKTAQALNYQADALKKRVETAKLLKEFKMTNVTDINGNAASTATKKSVPRIDHPKPLPTGAPVAT